MRILCLTPRLPYPPHGGDRLRAYHIIKRLSQEHELSLISFIAQNAEKKHLTPLRDLCRDVRVLIMSPFHSVSRVLTNLWRPDPMQALYYRSPAMQELVTNTLNRRQYDAAYVHLFRMAPYVAHMTNIYRIADLTDVISKGIGYSLPYREPVSRLIYRLEKPRIARYEHWVAQNFEETWLISAGERRHLSHSCPSANIHIVTNGVDTDLFHPTGRSCQPNSLLFVGKLSVFHNVDAAIHLTRDVLPLIRQKISDCRLDIVGVNADDRVQRLGKYPGVTVKGFAPDLNECLNRCAVFVAPLRAVAGVQNKVLEAMAAAKPVVTTSLVNRGLCAKPGRDLLIADDTETTARQVIKLLRNRQLRTQLGIAGRRFVKQHFKWDGVADRMRVVAAQLRLAAEGL